MIEKSDKKFDFAITISLYSEHNINKFCMSFDGKKKYYELTTQEQTLYLISLFTKPLDSRSIEYLYAIEFHTGIFLKGNMPKMHLHGTIKNVTYETMSQLKALYLKNYLKVSTDKAILDCFKCVPIVNEGWSDYCAKGQLDPNYWADIQNHLESDYLPNIYQFGKNKNI